MRSDRAAATALTVVLGGCGGLAGPDYAGEPLLTLEGTVLVDAMAHAIDTTAMRVALFWTGRGGALDAEQAVVVEADFPARYRLELVHPPPAHVLQRAEGPTGRVAIGHPLLYADDDGDGRWTPGLELLLGGSVDSVVVYTERQAYDARDPVAGWRPGHGLQRRLVNGPTCGPVDALLERLPEPVTATTDLVLGSMWPRLHDADCDPLTRALRLDEAHLHLDPACPPADDLARFCTALDAGTIAALQDPFLAGCLSWYCPTLEAIREVEDALGECPSVEVLAGDCATPEATLANDPCSELVCDKLAEHVDGPIEGSCPSAEEMLMYCRYPDAAERHGVAGWCLALYCPSPAPKEPEAPAASTEEGGDSGEVGTSAGSSDAPPRPRQPRDKGEGDGGDGEK